MTFFSKRELTILYIIILLFAACSIDQQSKREQNNVLNLESVVNKIEEKPLSNIAKKVTYIALETREESLLGMPDKIVFTDDYILITDQSDSNTGLYMYDKSGRFIRKIGNKGRGPGEYIQLADFTYNDGILYLLGNSKKHLLVFDMEGNLGRAIPISSEAINVEYFDGNFYGHIPSNFVFFKKDKNKGSFGQFFIMDKEGKLLAEDHPIKENAKTYANPFMELATFSSTDNNLYYHIPNEYILYETNGTALIPVFDLNFGKYSFPDDYEWSYENIQKAYDTEKVMLDKAFFAGHFLFIDYRIKSKRRTIVHNLNTQQSTNVGTSEQHGFIDDIDGLGHFSGYQGRNNLLVRSITADDFLSIKENSYGFSPKIKELRSKITSDSNIILQVVRL